VGGVTGGSCKSLRVELCSRRGEVRGHGNLEMQLKATNGADDKTICGQRSKEADRRWKEVGKE